MRVGLRESDGREIGRRRASQRAWLLARAVMKLEAFAGARRKSGRCRRTRTEAAASRGGRSSVRNGCARASKTYGRSWLFGSRAPSKRHAPAFVRRPRATWARANRVGTPRAHASEHEPAKVKRGLRSRKEAYLQRVRVSRRATSRGVAPFRKEAGARNDTDRRRSSAERIDVASRRVEDSGLGDSSPRAFG